MIKLITPIAILLLTFFMTGCGGGSSSSVGDTGSGGGTGDSGSSKPKIYPLFETGKIVYDIYMTADYGALGSIEVTGTKRVVFKDWGNVSVEETNKTSVSRIIDPSSGVVSVIEEKDHDMEKWVTPKKYDINFKKENITVIDFSVIYDNAQAIADAVSPTAFDSVNYVGKDIVNGLICDVYVIGAVTLCERYGVTLKSEVSLGALGYSTEIATFTTFNTHVLEDEFKIPAFPHININ